MENLLKNGPLFREFGAQKPTHMGGTYPYPQHVMYPPPRVKAMTSVRFSTYYFLGGSKKYPHYSINNLLRGIPFSQEDEIHEHIQVSVLLGRSTKETLACCFHSFLQDFERGLLRKISHFDGKEWPINAG